MLVRFLNLIRPFMAILPEVNAPDRKVTHARLHLNTGMLSLWHSNVGSIP